MHVSCGHLCHLARGFAGMSTSCLELSIPAALLLVSVLSGKNNITQRLLNSAQLCRNAECCRHSRLKFTLIWISDSSVDWNCVWGVLLKESTQRQDGNRHIYPALDLYFMRQAQTKVRPCSGMSKTVDVTQAEKVNKQQNKSRAGAV